MPYRPEDLDQMRLRQGEAEAKRKVREGQYTPSDPLYKFKDTGGEIGAPTAMDDVSGLWYDLNDTPPEGAQISPMMAGEAALAALTSGGSMGISNALKMTGRGRGAGSMQRAAREADFINETDRMASAYGRAGLTPNDIRRLPPDEVRLDRDLDIYKKYKDGIGKTGPRVERRHYEPDDIFDMSPEEIAKQKQTGEVQMSRVPSPEKQARLKRKAQSKKKRNAEAKRTTEPVEEAQIFDPPAPKPKPARLPPRIRDDVGAGERKRQRDMRGLEGRLKGNQGRDLHKFVGFEKDVPRKDWQLNPDHPFYGVRKDGSIADNGLLRDPDKVSPSEADFALNQETFVGKGADIPKTKTKAAKKSERREGKRKLRQKDNRKRGQGKSEATREDLFGVAGGLGAAGADEEINYSYGDD